jgi:hypothetical protein
MSARNHAGRAAEFEAKDILVKEGWECLRSARGSFNLIAWKGYEEVLAITVRRSRTFPNSHLFEKEISNICSIVESGKVPGNVEFWVKYSNEWIRYKVHPGGVIPYRSDPL